MKSNSLFILSVSLLILFGVGMSACTSQAPSDTPTPTYTLPPPTATATATATLTPTPTATPTIAYPLGPLDPLPPAPVLDDKNIGRIEPLMEFSSTAPVFRVEFSNDGKWMILYGGESLEVYDTQTFEKQNVFTNDFAPYVGEPNPESLYGFIPGKNWIIVNGEEIWDADTSQVVFRDPSVIPFEEGKTYAGFPNVFETGGDVLVRSFIEGVSADGRFVATGGNLWDLSTLETKPLGIDPHMVQQVVLSPGGHYYAVLDRDGKTHVFNVSDGKEITVLSDSQAIFFGADDKYFFIRSLTSYNYNEADLWSVRLSETGTWVGEFKPPLSGNIRLGENYFFLRGDNFQATESCDLHVYRIWPQEKINILKIPADSNTCKTFSGSYASEEFFGDLLVTVTFDGEGKERVYYLNAWNVETGESLFEQTIPEPAFVLGAQKDGQLFAFYKPVSGTIEIIDENGQLVKSFDGYYDLSAEMVVHSPDGKIRALVNGGNITLIDTSTKSVFRIIQVEEPVTQLIFLPENDMLVKTFGGLYHYKMADNSLRNELSDMFMGNITLLPDNSHFFMEGVVVGYGLNLYDLASFQRMQTFDAPGMSLKDSAISTDGKWLALSGAKHRNVFVFDIARGRVEFDLLVFKFVPDDMVFSKDGQILFLAGRDNMQRTWVQTWDLQTGKKISELEITPDWLAGLIDPAELEGRTLSIYSLSLSPDGTILAWIGASTIEGQGETSFPLLAFWRAGEEKPYSIVKNFSDSPIFSADGRFLVIGSSLWGVRP